MDAELNPGKKRLKIPASACQSIEFTKGGEKFSYNITAEEIINEEVSETVPSSSSDSSDPDLTKLKELKKEATSLCKTIKDTTETEFNEETIGK